MKVTHILNVTNNINCFFEDDQDVDFDYLKINIEDTSDVPIKLSFPVAWNFIENAFNECKLLSRDKSKRNNALVDDVISTDEGINH